MIAEPTRAEFDRLHAEVAALRRAANRPRPRRGRLAALALAILLAALVPLATLAATPTFGDLGTAAPVHQPNILAIAAAGITTGFPDPNATDPAARLYDPKAGVTREEMASFLARTAGLGGNPPVANAKTAQSADTATNAATLQGRPASTFGRAAAAKQGQAFSTAGGNIDTVAVSIVAPAPGYVLVGGATEIFANTCDVTNSECTFTTSLRHTGTADESPGLLTYLGGAGHDEVDTVSPTWVFPVQAGPQTFALTVHQTLGPAQAAFLMNNQITALYVPFGPDGNTP